jgi:hypothetical protein
MMDAERCAQLMLRGIERNKPIILITAEARILSLLHRVSPTLSVRVQQALAKRGRSMLAQSTPRASSPARANGSARSGGIGASTASG